jgi:hypothetical protein
MTLYTDLLNTVAEYRTKENIKNEKAYFKMLQEEYKSSNEVILGAISSLFLKHQRDGKLYQEDILKFNRIKEFEKIAGEELVRLQKVEAKEIKKRLEYQVKNEFAYGSFLTSVFKKNKKINITDKDIQTILDEEWSGEKYDQTLQRKKRDTVGAMKREILILSASNGTTLPALEKSINKKIETTMKHSLTVYRNENTRKQTKAEDLAHSKLGTGEKVQFIVTYDDRLCSDCEPYENQIFKLGDEPLIPIHSNCRCTTIHIIEGWEQTLRSARDLKTYETYTTSTKNFDDYKAEQGFNTGSI